MKNEVVETYTLTVKTGDAVSENYIIDSQFRNVARSVGQYSTFQLPKGLYSVKVKTGQGFTEKSVALRSDDIVIFETEPFSTSAPLKNTLETSDFQIDIAASYSKKQQADVSLGKGSKLFIFGSVYVGKQHLIIQEEEKDPARGLTLRNSRDEELINFGEAAIGAYSYYEVPWAACTVDLDPGIYCLSLETAKGDFFKQTIVTSRGWQTQVFLQVTDYGLTVKDIRANLTNASIFMVRSGIGFNGEENPDQTQSPNYRMTELVKHGLMTRRNVISDDLYKKLISGEFENPMLLLYASHLLLLKQSTGEIENAEIKINLEILVNQLRQMLGFGNPDIEALALKCGMPVTFVFTTFPMLAASWDLVIEASFHKPEIVPKDSISCINSTGLRNRALWLIWGIPFNKKKEHLIADQINLLIQQVLSRAEMEKKTSTVTADPGIFRRVITSIRNHKYFRKIAGLFSTLTSITTDLNNDQLLALILKVGMPLPRIHELLKNLQDNAATKQTENPNSLTSSKKKDDPQKGRWGSTPYTDTRKLSAAVELTPKKGLFNVVLCVESTKAEAPLTGKVQFYLHNTFLNPQPEISVEDGKAILKLTGVWGGFTVGAVSDEGNTKLELDLASLENAPEEFKEK